MNLNELNPTQIVLLTLLVSFVTSIATGIVTVSLVNQAPAVVTDTIHKVYEKTIEKVVPGEQTATIIENTETIIVSEEDFVIEAVNKNVDSLTRIYFYSEEEVDQEDLLSILKNKTLVKNFVGTALFFDESGIILAEKENFEEKIENISGDVVEGEKEIKDYFIELEGEEFSINIIDDQNENNNFVFLQIKEGFDLNFRTIEMGDSDNSKLGQSVVILGGEESNKVLTGVVSNLIKTERISEEILNEENQKKITVLNEIEINQNLGKAMVALIDLNGKVIGFRLGQDSFIPINKIQQSYQNLISSEGREE